MAPLRAFRSGTHRSAGPRERPPALLPRRTRRGACRSISATMLWSTSRRAVGTFMGRRFHPAQGSDDSGRAVRRRRARRRRPQRARGRPLPRPHCESVAPATLRIRSQNPVPARVRRRTFLVGRRCRCRHRDKHRPLPRRPFYRWRPQSPEPLPFRHRSLAVPAAPANPLLRLQAGWATHGPLRRVPARAVRRARAGRIALIRLARRRRTRSSRPSCTLPCCCKINAATSESLAQEAGVADLRTPREGARRRALAVASGAARPAAGAGRASAVGLPLALDTVVHAPGAVARSHAWHWPVHAESQQTPSTQKPLAHSVAPPQRPPFPVSGLDIPAGASSPLLRLTRIAWSPVATSWARSRTARTLASVLPGRRPRRRSSRVWHGGYLIRAVGVDALRVRARVDALRPLLARSDLPPHFEPSLPRHTERVPGVPPARRSTAVQVPTLPETSAGLTLAGEALSQYTPSTQLPSGPIRRGARVTLAPFGRADAAVAKYPLVWTPIDLDIRRIVSLRNGGAHA